MGIGASSAMGNAANKSKGAVTTKDIRAYQEQTNFSKVELKKVIAAFDKEANKVQGCCRCGQCLIGPSFFS